MITILYHCFFLDFYQSLCSRIYYFTISFTTFSIFRPYEQILQWRCKDMASIITDETPGRINLTYSVTLIKLAPNLRSIVSILILWVPTTDLVPDLYNLSYVQLIWQPSEWYLQSKQSLWQFTKFRYPKQPL